MNTWGEIASGVSRRPPTRFIAEIADPEGLDQAFIHHINRDPTERYIVVVSEGLIRVFDHLTGEEKTVNAPGGLDYLSASEGTSYRAVTVADYTFIVNTEIVCSTLDVGADEVDQPDYYVWPGGNNPRRAQLLDDFVVPGDTWQYPPNPAAPGAVAGTVQKFEDLPTTGVSVGDVYRIQGSADTGFITYYVRWSGQVWDETAAPGLKNALDAGTMPHALVRQSDGTFNFAPFSWSPRRVGDANTNPAPPFVGRRMRDVFFYQNRLGFLVDESVVFSAAGDYGDYWRRTVLDYIASDTLSVAAATTDVALLEYAVPFNDGIMLFSAQRQFSLSNGEAGLSADSIEINPVTSFAMSPGVRPVSIGVQVYFASEGGGHVAIQEYTRLDGSDATDAAEVTAHVPGLIGAGVTRIVPAPDLNAIIVIRAGAEDRNRVYAYQFFWDRDDKAISAWRPWDFGSGEVISGVVFDGVLRLVMKRGDTMSIETLDLRPLAVSDEQEHTIRLDRGVTLAGTYDAETDLTTFELPYVFDQDALRIIRTKDSTYPESLILPPQYEFLEDGVSVTVPGDETAHPVTAGEVYTSRLRFTRQYPHDYQGRPLTSGRLQLHTFSVTYSATVYFRAEVQPYGPDAVSDDPLVQTTAFNGRVIGSGNYRLGRQAYRTGTFTFPVAADASIATIELVNDSPYSSTWVSAEWEGLFFSRAL